MLMKSIHIFSWLLSDLSVMCGMEYGVGDINKLYSFVSLNSDFKVA